MLTTRVLLLIPPKRRRKRKFAIGTQLRCGNYRCIYDTPLLLRRGEITITTICQGELCIRQSEVFIIGGSFRSNVTGNTRVYFSYEQSDSLELDPPYDISHDFANYSPAQNKILYVRVLLKYRFLSELYCYLYCYLRHESERRK